MAHHSNPFYDKVLARVKDPARRRAMANLYDDTDRLLTDQVRKEAKERDKKRAAITQQLPNNLPNRKKIRKSA